MTDTPPTLGEKLAALRLYIDLSNSEKQAIWARHATMIVGNSLIINAIRTEPSTSSNSIWFNVAGLGLCVVWAIMTWVGWGWFYKAMQDSIKLVSDPLLNPFASFSNLASRRHDKVFICAMVVVGIFAFMYLIGLAPLLRSWI